MMELPSLAATEALAATVAALARAGDAILLEGELGAGKSAFARAFLRAATGDPALEVPSPTFTLVQSYDTRIGVVQHFDLWRLEGPGGLTELGWDEARNGIVLVEWPDRLGPLRPAEALTVALHPNRRGQPPGGAVRLAGPTGSYGMTRDTMIATFLSRHGYGEARAAPLAQDASFRRYLRLVGGPRPAMLMDAPPPEDIRPFVRIAEHLAAIGMSVPEIIAADESQGLLLEEDLGDDLFSTSMTMFMDKAGKRKNNTPPPLVRCEEGIERRGWRARMAHLTPTPAPDLSLQGRGRFKSICCSTPQSTRSWRCSARRRHPSCHRGMPRPWRARHW